MRVSRHNGPDDHDGRFWIMSRLGGLVCLGGLIQPGDRCAATGVSTFAVYSHETH